MRRGAPRRPHAAIGAFVFAAAITAAAPASAGRDRPVVVVAPFRGPQAQVPEQVVIRALKRYALVLSPTRFAIVAKALFAEGQNPEDLSAVAHELGAQWVVTATIKQDEGRWTLGVSLRDGRTGRSRAKLRYNNLPSPRPSQELLRTLATEISDAFSEALKNPTPSDDEPPPKPRAPRTPLLEPDGHDEAPAATPRTKLGDDDEAPPARPGEAPRRPGEPGEERTAAEPGGKPAEPTPTTRPRWARWLELGLGASITGRGFVVDPSPPKFSSPAVGGIYVDLVVYPLAFTWKNARGFFSGLGLGLSLTKPFPPDSTSRADPTQRFPTSELKVEGGLRYKLTLYKPMPRPQLTLIVEGGLHEYSFGKKADGTDLVGVPDVRYVYASIGGALTIHFAEWSWVWIQFVYHAVTDTGPIQSPLKYGLAQSYGLRFSAGLDFLVWRGIRVGAAGMYERFNLVFGYDPSNRAEIRDSATDEYYGGMLVLGYVL